MQLEFLDPTRTGLIRRIRLKQAIDNKVFPPKPSKKNRKAKHQYIDYQKQVYEKRIADNKEKYKEVYKQFFNRGGSAWFEVMTGKRVDLDKIYFDIDYFIDVLKQGIEYEEHKKKVQHEYNLELQELKRVASLCGKESAGVSAAEMRRILVRLGTPKWADTEKMKWFYTERDRLNRETGQTYHVDHIIPIKHKEVCGLNVEFNLQLLTDRDNMMKSNRFTDRG